MTPESFRSPTNRALFTWPLTNFRNKAQHQTGQCAGIEIPCACWENPSHHQKVDYQFKTPVVIMTTNHPIMGSAGNKEFPLCRSLFNLLKLSPWARLLSCPALRRDREGSFIYRLLATGVFPPLGDLSEKHPAAY